MPFNPEWPQQLWEGGLRPVYLLYGDEPVLRSAAAQALVGQAVAGEWRDFDVETLSAASTDAGVVLASASQAPLGDGLRVVLVERLEAWKEGGGQRSLELLATGIARLPKAACLVLLSASGAGRGPVCSAAVDAAVRERGLMIACARPKGDVLEDWARSELAQLGKRIEEEALQSLMDSSSLGLGALQQELQKLAAYAGERAVVTLEDVSGLVAESPQDRAFGVVDAVFRSDVDGALQMLAEMQRYEARPQTAAARLLALLARQLRLVWQARQLAEMGIRPADWRALPGRAAAELPADPSVAQVAFRSGDLARAARSWDWNALAGALKLVLECDLANKGAPPEGTPFSADAEGNLQLVVLQLATAQRR